MMSIKDFYNERDIFVTGATGFLGKMLVEKLLRSCSSVGRVFVLLRPKRSKSIPERLEEFKKMPVSCALLIKILFPIHLPLSYACARL